MPDDTTTWQPITLDNAKQLDPVQQATRGWIAQLVWSPDGRLLAAASAGGVAIWRGSLANRPVFIKQHDGPVKSVAFAPNSSTLATASADTTLKLWDLRAFSPTMQPLATYTDHTDAVESVLLARNGAVISAGVDGTVRIRYPQQTHILADHEGEVNQLALNSTHRVLASGGRDHSVRLWDTVNGRALAVLDGHKDWIRALAFHPNEDVLLSASRDGTAWLWDITNPAAPQSLATFQHEGDVRAAAFDATGTMIATGSTLGTIRLWDVASQQRIATLEKHSKPVVSLAFHPQNHFLTSGGGDNVIYLWGIEEYGV